MKVDVYTPNPTPQTVTIEMTSQEYDNIRFVLFKAGSGRVEGLSRDERETCEQLYDAVNKARLAAVGQ